MEEAGRQDEDLTFKDLISNAAPLALYYATFHCLSSVTLSWANHFTEFHNPTKIKHKTTHYIDSLSIQALIPSLYSSEKHENE